MVRWEVLVICQPCPFRSFNRQGCYGPGAWSLVGVQAKLLVRLVAFVNQRILQLISAVCDDLANLLATERRHEVGRVDSLQVSRDYLYQPFIVGGFQTLVAATKPCSHLALLLQSWSKSGMMEAKQPCFRIVVYETRPVNTSQYFLTGPWSSMGGLTSLTVLLAPWWSRGEGVPYVGSNAGFAGTG
jgi:hypothetical protein